ncbi:MAG: 2-oxoacid ferredoxin oxidoreductase [Desulfobacterales bacterium]|nr:2-oxoacid ferredoxin oxidoreductase [Desulfobacterales bacterium]
MTDVKIYDNNFENKWCPGCGNFAILNAMKKAFAEQDVPPENILIVSGIGQAGKTPHFLKCNYFHGLHGRALPVATGAKLANHELNIVVNMGDGDCYGEGGNHLFAAIRRNIDITLLVHNNMVYGLTKGQASPTSAHGFVTKAQPQGVTGEAMNPLTLAISQGAGFVARGYNGKMSHLSYLIREGMRHRGFSLIDILQVCVSFNHVNTAAFYNDRVYELDESQYPVDDWHHAMDTARIWGDRIPIGILYKKETESYTDRLAGLKEGPMVDRQFDSRRVKALILDT